MGDLPNLPRAGLRWTPPETACPDCAAEKTLHTFSGAVGDLTMHHPGCPTGASLFVMAVANSKD